MMDIESHTVVVLGNLLATRVVRDALVTSESTRWVTLVHRPQRAAYAADVTVPYTMWAERSLARTAASYFQIGL